MSISKLIAIAAISLFACSCKKKECKNANISGDVKHHALKIPFSRVFIKKGTNDSPGLDTNLYDIKASADANAHFTVANLEKDNYYIMGWGYDSSISNAVHGGVPFTISCDEDAKTYTIDVPVVE